jgi:ATP-dependent protease ClpP protease subunit
MTFDDRRQVYRLIEKKRKTRVIGYFTGDRPNLETVIAGDVVNIFVDLLEEIGICQKISLFLYTNGGQTMAAWRLVNLLRSYCDDLEVIIPFKALSAGTLISLGHLEKPLPPTRVDLIR